MNRQKEVLDCFKGDKDIVLSKKYIMQLAGLYYYHNSEKHAGEVLTRMVNRGLLKRVKKGYYSLGDGIKKKELFINPNQNSIDFNV